MGVPWYGFDHWPSAASCKHLCCSISVQTKAVRELRAATVEADLVSQATFFFEALIPFPCILK